MLHITPRLSTNYQMYQQGSESEDEEYHKKKKRSQSKSPSERSSSGESGEWLSKLGWFIYRCVEKVQQYWHLLTFYCLKPERSYKKSKKHKKKAKKRRHKSVSTREDCTHSMYERRMCMLSLYAHWRWLWQTQASPDTDNEKKGREREGKREKDLEKDKENDKSRGKSRSDSKQKSPKRKAAKEEVCFLYYYCGYEKMWVHIVMVKVGLRDLHTWHTDDVWGGSGCLVDKLKTLEMLHVHNKQNIIQKYYHVPTNEYILTSSDGMIWVEIFQYRQLLPGRWS